MLIAPRLVRTLSSPSADSLATASFVNTSDGSVRVLPGSTNHQARYKANSVWILDQDAPIAPIQVTRFAPRLLHDEPALSLVFLDWPNRRASEIHGLIATSPTQCALLFRHYRDAATIAWAPLCVLPADPADREDIGLFADLPFLLLHKQSLVGFQGAFSMAFIPPVHAAADRTAAVAAAATFAPEWEDDVHLWAGVRWDPDGGDVYERVRDFNQPTVAQIITTSNQGGVQECPGVLVGPHTVMATASCLLTMQGPNHLGPGHVVLQSLAVQDDTIDGRSSSSDRLANLTAEVFPFVAASVSVAATYGSPTEYSNDYAEIHLPVASYQPVAGIDAVGAVPGPPTNGTRSPPLGRGGHRFFFPRTTLDANETDSQAVQSNKTTCRPRRPDSSAMWKARCALS